MITQIRFLVSIVSTYARAAVFSRDIFFVLDPPGPLGRGGVAGGLQNRHCNESRAAPEYMWHSCSHVASIQLRSIYSRIFRELISSQRHPEIMIATVGASKLVVTEPPKGGHGVC